MKPTRWCLALLLCLAPSLAGAIPTVHITSGVMGGIAESLDFSFDVVGPNFFTHGISPGQFPFNAFFGTTYEIGLSNHETAVNGVTYTTECFDQCSGGQLTIHQDHPICDVPLGCPPAPPWETFVPFTMEGLLAVVPDPSLDPLFEFHLVGQGTLHAVFFGPPHSDSGLVYRFTVPEPSTLLLLGVALGGLGVVARGRMGR
jgi:hypothetical protein